MRETPPTPDVLCSLFPCPFSFGAVGEEHIAETQQVCANYSNEEESPEPETSRSRRRQFKASNMPFVEMVKMVDILADYDGKYGPYPNPNVRKKEL
ncbi:hypothetical protein AB205_0044460 [Aquarana catesbeiana]|uniref:Uncharacterized protein n=1 Tax=Aquarana catesbeiana TaxID=8400 RepID=A0A2G9RQD5_AQUCT|nr:hypothetical protein AB205_0044460 [Aquarana catesbeiana]